MIVEEVNDKESKRVMINNNPDEEDSESYSYHIEDKQDTVKSIELTFK